MKMVLSFYLSNFFKCSEEYEELLESDKRIRNKVIRLHTNKIAVRQSHIDLCNYLRSLVKEHSILFITNQIKDVLIMSGKENEIELLNETKINNFISYIYQLDDNDFEMTIKCLETFIT